MKFILARKLLLSQNLSAGLSWAGDGFIFTNIGIVFNDKILSEPFNRNSIMYIKNLTFGIFILTIASYRMRRTSSKINMESRNHFKNGAQPEKPYE